MLSGSSRTIRFLVIAAIGVGVLGETAVTAFRARTLRIPLFAAAQPRAVQTWAPGPEVVRSRYVAIDVAALLAARPDQIDAATRPVLLLNVFDDLAYHAEVDRVDMVEDGFTWVGHVWGHDPSTVTLACVDGVVAGSIVMPDAVFAIRYVGDGAHEITQIDQASPLAELASMPVEPGAGITPGVSDSSAAQAGASLQGDVARDVTTSGPRPVAIVGVEATAAVGAASVHPAGTNVEIAANLPIRAATVPGRVVRQPLSDVLNELKRDPAGGSPGERRIRDMPGPPSQSVVDMREDGAEISSPFVLWGRSGDITNAAGAGVDTVHVWALQAGGDARGIARNRLCPKPGAAAIWLGAAIPGPPAPDGIGRDGPARGDASYRLDVNNLAPGQYVVVICPRRASTGQFDGARTLRLTVR